MSEGSDPMQTAGVHSLILRHGVDHADKTALIYPRSYRRGYASMTYGELRQRVASCAAGLAERGVGRGDRVVVLVPMSPDLYVVLLAIASLGSIAVFVEPSSTLAEIARAIRVSRPKAFIGIPKAHALRLRYRHVAAVPVTVVAGSFAVAKALGAPSLRGLEAEHPLAPLPDFSVDPGDPVLLTFSSGSTGKPKGATRSHAFLAAQHAAIDGRLDRRSGVGDVDMSAFAIVLLSSLVRGNTAIIPRMGRGGVNDIDGRALARTIERYGVSVISGSPAFVAPIIAAAADRPLTSIRRILTGGAPVPVELCEDVAGRLGPEGTLLVAYGSTEAEPISTILASEVRDETAAATRRGAGLCVGRLHHDIELALLRPSRDPLAIGPGGIDALRVVPGDVGEVTVAGPHVNQRYYRNDDAVRRLKVTDESGRIWHRTGDAAYLDEQGRLWIVGRINDVVRRGEAVYYPAAVEAAARGVRGVDRAALIEDGPNRTAVVVQPNGSRPRPDAIVRRLREVGVEVDRVAFARLPVDPRHRAKLDYPAIRRRFSRSYS
jgi:acyl-CoA synthetase (AMP-forming)/AMP-acid ligase II